MCSSVLYIRKSASVCMRLCINVCAFLKDLLLMCMRVCLCVCHMCMRACQGQKRKPWSWSYSHWTWVIGTELGSSRRASALNYWTRAYAPHPGYVCANTHVSVHVCALPCAWVCVVYLPSEFISFQEGQAGPCLHHRFSLSISPSPDPVLAAGSNY